MGVYERLGVRPVVNAGGMITVAGGSLMPKQVLEAICEAATAHVDLVELHQKAGRRLAELIGVEAAHVTAGSAAGLLLSAAAVIAGDDPARIAQLPDTSGLRDEIIIQACNRNRYDQALRLAGAKLVEAGDLERCSPEQIEAAIGPKSAAIAQIVSPRAAEGGVPTASLAEIAHRHGLPLIVDAASTLPPSQHLTRWTDQGADLVIYSGGKGIRGPQGSGLLLGRADLVRAAAANAAPNASVGRPAKVSKEDIVGLVVAVELFLQTDHRIEWERHLREAWQIYEAIADLPGISAQVESDDSVWASPNVLVAVDQAATGFTVPDLQLALQRGEPPIMTRVLFSGELVVDPHGLQPGEPEIVARRLREELSRVAVGGSR